VTAPTDIDGLSLEALQALVVQLLSKVGSVSLCAIGWIGRAVLS
jgi:hypothetical protein